MALKHLKKCSASLDIKEMQIKTTLRFLHLTLVRMAKAKDTVKRTKWQPTNWEKIFTNI